MGLGTLFKLGVAGAAGFGAYSADKAYNGGKGWNWLTNLPFSDWLSKGLQLAQNNPWATGLGLLGGLIGWNLSKGGLFNKLAITALVGGLVAVAAPPLLSSVLHMDFTSAAAGAGATPAAPTVNTSVETHTPEPT